MKNSELWRPSKYVVKEGTIQPTDNWDELSPTSYLIAYYNGLLYEKYLPMYASGNLIDLGCGKVPFYFMYKDYINHQICVDWKNSLHDNPLIDYYCDLSEKLPFEDESFDTVIMSDVLEHLFLPDLVWKEMRRILRKDGIVILNVPFLYWIHEAPHDYHRYTEYSLRRFAENNGFEIVQLIPGGGVLEILTDIIGKVFLSKTKFRKKLALKLQKICIKFATTKTGSRIQNKYSSIYPLFYFMVAKRAN